MIPAPALTAWLSRLVQIPSVTPVPAGPKALAHGPAGEARLAEHLAEWFRRFGGQVTVEEVQPGRPSVYAIWGGRTDRWAALDVHTDTVGVEQMGDDPFSGAIRDGRVWGRGAVDTKASLAIALALLEEMHRRDIQPEPNLLIGATVDEEFGATGAPAFAAWIRRQGLVIHQFMVAEPTGCVPVHGHKGVARFELTVHGEAAHTSQPERGKNAVIAAARIVLAYQAEHERLQTLPPTALGRANLTVAQIQGGTGINVVPDRCRLGVDRRVLDGESPPRLIDELYALAQAATPLPVAIQRLREMDAFLQPPDAPWIRQLAAWSGHQPAVAPYGTNAWAYKDLPGETVVMGPGSIDQAHAAQEWVAIDQLEKMAGIYARWWGLMDGEAAS